MRSLVSSHDEEHDGISKSGGSPHYWAVRVLLTIVKDGCDIFANAASQLRGREERKMMALTHNR